MPQTVPLQRSPTGTSAGLLANIGYCTVGVLRCDRVSQISKRTAEVSPFSGVRTKRRYGALLAPTVRASS